MDEKGQHFVVFQFAGGELTSIECDGREEADFVAELIRNWPIGTLLSLHIDRDLVRLEFPGVR